MVDAAITREFKEFAIQLGCGDLGWFEKPYDDYSPREMILFVALPYNFVAKKMGINISVCIETAGEHDHFIIAYGGKIVLEDLDFTVSDFCWNSHEFAQWFNATVKDWTQKLKLAKLLFDE